GIPIRLHSGTTAVLTTGPFGTTGRIRARVFVSRYKVKRRLLRREPMKLNVPRMKRHIGWLMLPDSVRAMPQAGFDCGARAIFVVLACCVCLSARAAPAADDLFFEGGSGKPEKSDVLFAMSQTAEQAAFMLALNEGYFKEQGLDVTWKPRGGANAITGL